MGNKLREKKVAERKKSSNRKMVLEVKWLQAEGKN